MRKEEPLNLKKEVFQPVVERIKGRSESLKPLKGLGRIGLEGWFKVEIIAALRDKVITPPQRDLSGRRIHQPDLLLKGNQPIELKAVNCKFEEGWVKDGMKYGHPCLFLYRVEDKTMLTNQISLLKRENIRNVGCDFFDAEGTWVIGMVKPTNRK